MHHDCTLPVKLTNADRMPIKPRHKSKEVEKHPSGLKPIDILFG
jgi:hypothetical protein